MDRWKMTIGALAGFATIMSVALVGQTQRTPATLDDLLAEVQGLRADLHESSSASVRAQLLLARLSLEEQRINTLGRELTEVRARLEVVVNERVTHQDRLKELEAAMTDSTVPVAVRLQFEAERAQVAALLARAQTSEQRVRNQQSDIANLISSEQSQWKEYSGRLDDLEHSLVTGGK
jgi:chromosome segregation ATPase